MSALVPAGRFHTQWFPARVLMLFSSLSVLLSGCTFSSRVVSWAATGYLEEGALVFQQEPDPQLAEEAIPANFKLLEILLHRTPNDPALNALAAQYLATYAYAFVEPRIEELELQDPVGSEAARARASAFYLRARAYGLRALESRPGMRDVLGKPLSELELALAGLGTRQVPALFWTAFCWGSYVNLNLDSPEALADSAAVSAMMRRIEALDETYYYGGVHLFFGALNARLPAGAGGNSDESRARFERAIALSEGRLLMTRVFFARYYAVRVQDRALFERTLQEVIETNIQDWPDERLANELAIKRARFYLLQADEYFLGGSSPMEEP